MRKVVAGPAGQEPSGSRSRRRRAAWSQSSYHRWRIKYWPKATAAVGIKATPYALRHSFANLLPMARHPPAWVAEQMGHTLQTLDKDYRHIIARSSASSSSTPRPRSARRARMRVLLALEQRTRKTGS